MCLKEQILINESLPKGVTGEFLIYYVFKWQHVSQQISKWSWYLTRAGQRTQSGPVGLVQIQTNSSRDQSWCGLLQVHASLSSPAAKCQRGVGKPSAFPGWCSGWWWMTSLTTTHVSTNHKLSVSQNVGTIVSLLRIEHPSCPNFFCIFFFKCTPIYWKLYTGHWQKKHLKRPFFIN